MQNKNMVTTILGAVAGVGQLLHTQGVHLGHVGNGDFISLIVASALAALGYYAVDKGNPAVNGNNGK